MSKPASNHFHPHSVPPPPDNRQAIGRRPAVCSGPLFRQRVLRAAETPTDWPAEAWINLNTRADLSAFEATHAIQKPETKE